MRKRKKKKIAVALDDDGYYLNCYGNRMNWSKAELKKAKARSRKFIKRMKNINWE